MEVAKYKIAKSFILTSCFGRRMANGAILYSTPKVLIGWKKLLGLPKSRALSEKVLTSPKSFQLSEKAVIWSKKSEMQETVENAAKKWRTL
jgi:hypothetical protein